MDPLSVTASIIAILTAAQKVSACIGTIASKSKNAPEEILELKSTVDTTHAVLSQLQAILFGRMSLDASRPALVLVDQVVVILTACVQIFSDLETKMLALNSNVKISILDRLKWATKTSEVKEYLVKLEAQKNSLNLILTILTCESMFEANSAVERLEALVRRVLGSDEDLARRMSVPVDRPGPTTAMDTNKLSTGSNKFGDTDSRVFDFQQDLDSSRAYSRNGHHESDDFSVRSRFNTGKASIMSRISLADVANIGDISLPITAKDLSNTVPDISSAPRALYQAQPSISSPKTRRVTFIASTEYVIDDWAIKIRLGPLGWSSQLISETFTHVDLIWVVPCFGNVDYPIDQIGEPFNIRFGDELIPLTAHYHRLRNITYVLLDCAEFRKHAWTDRDETGVRIHMSLRYCAIWNQSISKIMNQFHFDDYLIFDIRCTLALLYLLPRTVPCCFLYADFGLELWQNVRRSDLLRSIEDIFDLETPVIEKYFGVVEKLDFVFMIASYLKYHQCGRGFVCIGPRSIYDTRSSSHQAISREMLRHVTYLQFPDKTDTEPFDPAEENLIDRQKLYKGQSIEQSRSHARLELQKWANLECNANADVFVYVSRWCFAKGVDLLANVLCSVLQRYENTQVICVGPPGDQCARDAEPRLTALRTLFPTRAHIVPEYTTLPVFLFTGAEFTLLPSRYDSFGRASFEWGRRGAICIGSQVGIHGQGPGFLYETESDLASHVLEGRFLKAIEAALRSTLKERISIRAVITSRRYPVAPWKQSMVEIQGDCIRYHQRSSTE